MQTIVEVKDLNKNFYGKEGELEVLKNINFSLKEGEILTLLGPSGSGKSTILNILTKLLKPTSGEVNIQGTIGYMFQKDHLLEWRNIMDNITIGLEIQHKKTPESIARIENLLKTYGLWEFRNMYPFELSGGMRQRVALIRTLSVDPSILLLDEPFSALDYQTRLLVSDDVYKIIRNEHKSAILVTQDELDESTFGGRLRKSRIEKDLSIKELASICNVTPSVISSYEVNRYYPSIDTLNRLEMYFDINYLCRDGYSNFLWNHDTFINNLKLWINDNGYTRIEAAKLLGVSHSIFRFWFKGSIVNMCTYNRILKNIKQYKLI